MCIDEFPAFLLLLLVDERLHIFRYLSIYYFLLLYIPINGDDCTLWLILNNIYVVRKVYGQTLSLSIIFPILRFFYLLLPTRSMLSTMGTYPKNIIRTSDITVLYSLFDQEEAGLFKDFLKPKMTLQSIY